MYEVFTNERALLGIFWSNVSGLYLHRMPNEVSCMHAFSRIFQIAPLLVSRIHSLFLRNICLKKRSNFLNCLDLSLKMYGFLRTSNSTFY